MVTSEDSEDPRTHPPVTVAAAPLLCSVPGRLALPGTPALWDPASPSGAGHVLQGRRGLGGESASGSVPCLVPVAPCQCLACISNVKDVIYFISETTPWSTFLLII